MKTALTCKTSILEEPVLDVVIRSGWDFECINPPGEIPGMDIEGSDELTLPLSDGLQSSELQDLGDMRN